MRTNIVIDDKLIAEATKLSGARTKLEAVEDSLRLMVRLKRQDRRSQGLTVNALSSTLPEPVPRPRSQSVASLCYRAGVINA
jgi:Arc/MetJ family transcription regulator